MAFANDFNNWAQATYAQQNFSELFQNEDVQKLKWLQALYPLLQSGLNFGLDKIIENQLNTISNPVQNNGNQSARFNEAWNNLTNTNNSIQEAINAKIPGYKTELFLNELNNFKIESPELKLNKQLSPSNPMDQLSLNDTSQNNGNNSQNNLGLSFKQGLSTSAGVIAGAGVGYGLSALGNKLLGNSKGANFTTGAISQLGSTVAGNVAGTLASNALGTSTQTVGQGLSSLGSAASLTSGAAALGNIALDAFDPVKKHWSENVVGLGGAVASLAIPGAGPFIAAGLLAANAVGHILGDKTQTYTRDSELESQIGASYGGFLHDSAKADALADTKYSAFNSAARRKDDRFISDVKRMMSGLTGIRDLAQDKFTIKNSMAAINGNRRALELQGGFQQGTVHAAKHGGRIQKILAKYKEGGSINNVYQEFLNSFPPEEQGLISDDYRMYDYWNYNGRPKYFEDAVVKGMFNIDSKGKYHANTIAWNPETGEGEFMKSSKHPTLWREEEYYNGNEVVLKEGKEDNGNKENYDIIPLKGEELAKWKQFVSKYKLDKSGEYYKYIPIKEFKEGGSFPEKINEESIISLIPSESIISLVQSETIITPIEFEEIQEFKEGGSFNIIPDGALHAHLHHMEDADNLTKKGIPVVSEGENGELEQQAEIEREEIIFRLEVTKKLEELAKEGTDEAAIEAGKLLVYEILNNTIDNTDLLNTIN